NRVRERPKPGAQPGREDHRVHASDARRLHGWRRRPAVALTVAELDVSIREPRLNMAREALCKIDRAMLPARAPEMHAETREATGEIRLDLIVDELTHVLPVLMDLRDRFKKIDHGGVE